MLCFSHPGAIVKDPFAKKLNDLGFELPHWCEPPSEELVAQFEELFSVSLPPDYREFLIRHGGKVSYGGNPICPVQEVTPFGSEACVNSFYGFGPPERVDNIIAATKLMQGAPSFIVIGCDLMGNYVELKCDGRDVGHVYTFDHEGRSGWTDEMFYEMFPKLGGDVKQYLEMRKKGKLPRKAKGYEHWYRLGRSFTEFIECLKAGPGESDEEIPLDPERDRIPIALRKRAPEILRELLESGNLNKDVYHGQTPTEIITVMGDLAALHWLLDAGGQLVEGSLCRAARNAKADMVRFLIERGFKLDERWRGMTPLMHAVENAFDIETHLEVARLLIEHGADVNAISDEGKSVLQIAGGERYSTGRSKGPPKMVTFLEAAGARLSPRNDQAT
jgi:hypothetical protein